MEYVYLLSLQVAAFILAILTRKVKIKVLNDSKGMIIIVYSSTTIMLILGVLTFAVGTRFILIEVIFCGLIMTATTIFLTILFIPKVGYTKLRLNYSPSSKVYSGTSLSILRTPPYYHEQFQGTYIIMLT